MTPFNKISAIVYYIKDLNRTVTFYKDALGLTVTPLETPEGPLGTLEIGGLSLVFIPAEEKPGQSPVVVFGLEQGIEQVVEGLANQGVEIVTPVSHAPDGGLTADFLDPDGHTLSVYQPAG